MAKKQEKQTVAEQWLEKIDRPMDEAKNFDAGTDKRAVRRMKDAAEDVLPCASRRYTDVYVFSDGSGLYLKREDDWYPLDTEEVEQCRN